MFACIKHLAILFAGHHETTKKRSKCSSKNQQRITNKISLAWLDKLFSQNPKSQINSLILILEYKEYFLISQNNIQTQSLITPKSLTHVI